MTDKSTLERSRKLKAKEPNSIADDANSKPIDINQASTEKHETSRPIRVAKSKREIMEELSRERFPWEE